MLHATCYMLHATCYMLHATCYMLHATCYMLHATCYMPVQKRTSCSSSSWVPVSSSSVSGPPLIWGVCFSSSSTSSWQDKYLQYILYSLVKLLKVILTIFPCSHSCWINKYTALFKHSSVSSLLTITHRLCKQNLLFLMRFNTFRFNSSKCSPIMPDEVWTPDKRSETIPSSRIIPDPSDSQLHVGASSLQFNPLIFYRVQVRGLEWP